MWSDTQQQPADAFFQEWLREAKQQQGVASRWWHSALEPGRVAWMQQQQRQQQGAARESEQAAAAGGGMLSSVSSWISRKTQWATSSSTQQTADSAAADSSAFGGCPLCAQEQQAPAAAAAAGDTSTATASTTEPPLAACYIPNSPQHAWKDPFMWRRLVWGLLGRQKPTARDWYVQYYGMCPHTDDHQLWGAVARSVRRHLWLPRDADAVQWQLSGRYCLPHTSEQQNRMMVQYARALNEAFQVGAWL
jgi:hypothetical protein